MLVIIPESTKIFTIFTKIISPLDHLIRKASTNNSIVNSHLTQTSITDQFLTFELFQIHFYCTNEQMSFNWSHVGSQGHVKKHDVDGVGLLLKSVAKL